MKTQQTFNVAIEEIRRTHVSIQASSLADAVNKIREKYRAGVIFLASEEPDETNYKLIIPTNF